MKLTAIQRQALIAARDFGSAWNIDATRSKPWNASSNRAFGKLVNAGLLTFHHQITEAGRKALEA